MFGKLAFSNFYLATPTNRSPAAYRVDIDAEAAGGIKDWRRARETTSLSRGYKDNHGIFIILIAHTPPDFLNPCPNGAGGYYDAHVRHCLLPLDHDNWQSIWRTRRRGP